MVKVHVSNFGEHFNLSGLHKAWNQHHCTSGSITEAQLIPGVLGEQRCDVACCKAIGDPKLGTLATCQVRKQRILYHLLLPALKYCGNSSKLLLPGRSERKYFGFSKAPPPSKSVLQVWSDVPNAHSESLWSPQSTCANCASSSGFLAKYMQNICKSTAKHAAWCLMMLPSSWISSFTSEINRRDMPHQRSATENSVPWREALHLCPALNPEALGQTLEALGKTFWRLKIIWNHAELSPLAFQALGGMGVKRYSVSLVCTWR